MRIQGSDISVVEEVASQRQTRREDLRGLAMDDQILIFVKKYGNVNDAATGSVGVAAAILSKLLQS